ncbi:hypothetical protein KC345_g5557 [Hortaea werneckii]|nr:hypothetical protein KC345_g5557 [Hortaea werneckii]
MEELRLLMEKLDKTFKTQNAQFGRLVSEKNPASPRDGFKTKVRTLAKDAAFQGPKLLYSVNFGQREAILQEVEKYIDRLKELLQAILWSSSFARNPLDPFQRLAIAQEWARDVELEADADFAEAALWCLQRAPVDASRTEWRKEFVQSVIQPLERCCKSMAPRKAGISPGSSAAAV